jgi:hypothetical protein
VTANSNRDKILPFRGLRGSGALPIALINITSQTIIQVAQEYAYRQGNVKFKDYLAKFTERM